MVSDYYTYAYLREDRTPYYIGKGRGKRIYSKHRKIKVPKCKSRILFLKKGLTEAEAFKHEVYMIFVLGRKDLGTGILRNLTNGGEGSSGAVVSEETKKKQSVSRTGVPKSEEWKKAHSEIMTGKHAGENNPNYGNIGALSSSSKAVIAIKPDGTELHFGGTHEAARELETDQRHLSGRYLKTGHVLTKGPFTGWKFAYKNS
jgi:hypothetical protein